jgi:hypothetical protein
MPSVSYQFFDLPLLRAGQLKGITVSGDADIGFFPTGTSWWIEGIAIAGERYIAERVPPATASITLSPHKDETRPWYAMVSAALERECSDEIMNAIRGAELVEDHDPVYRRPALTLVSGGAP